MNEIHSFDSFRTADHLGRTAAQAAGGTPYAHALPAASPAASQDRWADLSLAVLDEIDHGLVVVGVSGEVRFANRAAWRACGDPSHPLQIKAGHFQLPSDKEFLRLQQAVEEATKGRRSMVDLGTRDGRTCVAVVPLATSYPVPSVLLILGRQGRHDVVALQLFAKSHGLTAAESAVLVALSEGYRPREIAERHGVAVCTVRTQIRDIRVKTATESINSLLQLVGRLPPMALSMGPVIGGSHGQALDRAASSQAGRAI